MKKLETDLFFEVINFFNYSKMADILTKLGNPKTILAPMVYLNPYICR